MTEFYDAENLNGIPRAAEYVALYADGDFSARGNPLIHDWPPRHRRWITIAGDETCSIADYEPENPVFDVKGALYDWAHKRIALHRGTTIVYSDRSDAESGLAELADLADKVIWWIATGDDIDWTPAQLAVDLATRWGAPIPAARIWANQNVWAQSYDKSNLFGRWRP
jgi:hypothetical protein